MKNRRVLTPRRVIGLSLGVVALLAVLPARWVGFVGEWLRGPVQAVLTPAAAPMRAVGTWLRPADAPGRPRDEVVRELERQRDVAQTRQRQAEDRLRELERQLQELIRLAPMRDAVERSVSAAVVSASTDLSSGMITVRAGSEEGVWPGCVAVAGGVNLIGRVAGVRGPLSVVLPVTQPQSGLLDAVVDVEGAGQMFACQIRPAGDGTLRGDLVAEAVGVAPGMRVRLRDAAWPPAAQMLVIGRVESVNSKPEQPLRKTVTVRPEMDPRRVREVVLLAPRGLAPGGARPTPSGGVR